MQIETKHVVLIELFAGNILISMNNKQHALSTKIDRWQANSEKSELIISNTTSGFPSLSILKLLKAEKREKISEEGETSLST